MKDYIDFTEERIETLHNEVLNEEEELFQLDEKLKQMKKIFEEKLNLHQRKKETLNELSKLNLTLKENYKNELEEIQEKPKKTKK